MPPSRASQAPPATGPPPGALPGPGARWRLTIAVRIVPGAVAPSPPRPTAPRPAAAHETDPTVAATLFAAWSGDPAVVVASPPGAGKTRLVVHLAEQLHRRAGLDVAIATQ